MGKYYTHVICTPTEFDWIEPYMEVVPDLVAQRAERIINDTRLIGTEENKIPVGQLQA